MRSVWADIDAAVVELSLSQSDVFQRRPVFTALVRLGGRELRGSSAMFHCAFSFRPRHAAMMTRGPLDPGNAPQTPSYPACRPKRTYRSWKVVLRERRCRRRGWTLRFVARRSLVFRLSVRDAPQVPDRPLRLHQRSLKVVIAGQASTFGVIPNWSSIYHRCNRRTLTWAV